MVNAWTAAWTARHGSRARWRPGRANGMIAKHASIGRSPWPPLGTNSANFTRQSKIDDPLVVFDEAHKLAAHFFGSKLEKTGRFRFAEQLGKETRHLLLMTATPHNGKEEDF